jgi:hypothetical protein
VATDAGSVTVKIKADADQAIADMRTLRTEAIKARRAVRNLGLVSRGYVGIMFVVGLILGELAQRFLA